MAWSKKRAWRTKGQATKATKWGQAKRGPAERAKILPLQAIFRSGLRTNKNGEIRFEFNLPDTLTTYRATAIAISRRSFGHKGGHIYVRNPINMKAALPRVLRERDQSDLGVMVNNVSGETQKLEIVAESHGNLKLEVTKRNLTLKSGETKFVGFPSVALKAGAALVNFELNSAVLKDRLQLRLTIEKPYVYESFAAFGKLDLAHPVRQEKLAIPSSSVDGKGKLSIKLSTGDLSVLSGALKYLREYSYLRKYGYHSAELATSVLLPYLVLGDLLPQIDRQGIALTRQEIQKRINEILRQQSSDGGFTFWLEPGTKASLSASSRVGFFAYIAEMYGYRLTKRFSKEKLISFITDSIRLESEPLESEPLEAEAMAFAYYVAAMLDEPSKAAKYAGKISDSKLAPGQDRLYLSILLALSLLRSGDWEAVSELHGQIKQYIKAGTRSIDFVKTGAESIDPFGHMAHTKSEILALYLMLLIQSNDRSGLAQKVANTLVGNRQRGHWGGSRQNVLVITAFAMWKPPANNSNKVVHALAKLNGKELLSFIGQNNMLRSFAFTEEPLKALERDALQDLRFELGNSAEEVYYTAELGYSIPVEGQQARDEGLSVFYEIMDMEQKIMAKELALGQTYRMNVYVSTSRNRSNLIVKIPLPSGAEVLDGSFVTSAQAPPQEDPASQAENRWFWWYDSSKQFIYDNHVLMAYEHFQQGYRKSSFLFRTTTAGKYPTPPVQAEAMYEAEVFGRSEGSLFIIF